VTRETAASSGGPGQAGRNGHAAACWPARPAQLLPRALPMTGPGPVKPPAASSTGRTGLMRPRPVAGLPVRRDLRARETAGTAPWLALCQAPGNGADVTGADDARRSRAEHGFPERIEDPAAVALLAALMRDARPPPRNETGRRAARPAA
jgi:hypothetical protein